MNPLLFAAACVGGLFGGMLVLLEVGRRIGLRRLEADPDGAKDGLGTIDSAIFGLFGLLLAFVFADASRRFDERRRLIVEESNDIGTAWLRLDLTPPSAQPALRAAFRSYVDARIELYRSPPEEEDWRTVLARSNVLQGEVWRLSVAACSEPEGERARMLLLPALNEMIDITTTRLSLAYMHPPGLVFTLLVLLALMAALLAGIALAGGRGGRWVHRLGFAALISGTIYLVAEIEFPRRGLVRIDAFDNLLVEVRRGMG